MSKEESRFFLTFIGEMVMITTDIATKAEMTSEEGTMYEEGPLRLQGFLLDEDDKFYYLGGSPDNVTDAIKKIAVKHIKIIPARTQADDIFDGMEPEGSVN